jgi:hypothetical protein
MSNPAHPFLAFKHVLALSLFLKSSLSWALKSLWNTLCGKTDRKQAQPAPSSTFRNQCIFSLLCHENLMNKYFFGPFKNRIGKQKDFPDEVNKG